MTPQLVLGLMVIAAGVLLTLDNLGVAEANRYLRFWPAGLLLLGLLKLWQSQHGAGTFGGIVLTAVGAWLLLEQSAIVTLSIRDLWPVLLVLLGGFLVWQGLSGPAPRPAANANAIISAAAILGSVVQGSNSRAFRGGDLTAILGGCEIDLRNAAIEGEAVIEIFALWGGIEIRVPEDWTVVSHVTPVLGGVEDKTRAPQSSGRHVLLLRGVVTMAGVEIKN